MAAERKRLGIRRAGAHPGERRVRADAALRLGRRAGHFLAATTLPQSLLLPLLGVMAVTSEWGQRTALVTFTLEPRRLRVLLAKLVGSLALGVVAIAVAFVFAALATGLGELLRDGAGEWQVSLSTVSGIILSQLLVVAQGVGFLRPRAASTAIPVPTS